jgi:ABC-type bacteriocin/lantibiotic exporter with double-glycine peptidase domain
MEELFLISVVAVFIIGLIGIKSRHYLLKLYQRAWEQRKQQTAYIKESEKLQQLSVSTPY